ncbi:MAG: ATP-binding protein [Clostridia bacterium]
MKRLSSLICPPSVQLPNIDDPARYLLEHEAKRYNETAAAPNGYACAECNNKGWIDVVRDGGVVRIPCRCQKIRKTLRLAQKSGLSTLLTACTFSRYETKAPWQSQLKDAAMRYAKSPEGWFYLGGQVGCGKTHLCTAIVGAMLKQGKSARYMMWRDGIATLKAMRRGEDGDAYNDGMGELKTVDVLYIDDLFKGSITDADKNIAFELVNARYNARLPTIFSGEKTIQALCEIDEAVGSRILQLAGDNAFEIGADPSKCWRYQG